MLMTNLHVPGILGIGPVSLKGEKKMRMRMLGLSYKIWKFCMSTKKFILEMGP